MCIRDRRWARHIDGSGIDVCLHVAPAEPAIRVWVGALGDRLRHRVLVGVGLRPHARAGPRGAMNALIKRVAMTALLVFWALPLCWMVLASLRPESALYATTATATAGFGGNHYRALFAERRFWQPMLNSIVVASSTTLLALVVAVPCAYAMARLQFRGKRAQDEKQR